MNPFLWLVLTVLDIYFWIVIAWVVSSWLVAFNIINAHNGVVAQILYGLSRLVEPVLRPIRRFLPDLGGLDISPVIALIGITFLRQLIVWLWFSYIT